MKINRPWGQGLGYPCGQGHRNPWGQRYGNPDLAPKTDGTEARPDPSAPSQAASRTAMATPQRELPLPGLPTNQRRERAVSEPIRSEDGSAKSSRAGPSRARAEPSRSERGRAEPSPVRAEPNRAEQGRAEPSRRCRGPCFFIQTSLNCITRSRTSPCSVALFPCPRCFVCFPGNKNFSKLKHLRHGARPTLQC